MSEGFDIRKTDIKVKGDNGIQHTQGLFLEYSNPDAPYTLRNADVKRKGKPYRSMYKIFMECVDEYEAAERLLGSQAHWRKLCGINWFMKGIPEVGFEGLETWREDMVRRDESLAKKILIEQAKEGNVSAARALQSPQKQKPNKKAKETQTKPEKNNGLFVGFEKAQGGIKNVQ